MTFKVPVASLAYTVRFLSLFAQLHQVTESLYLYHLPFDDMYAFADALVRSDSLTQLYQRLALFGE